MFWEIFKLIQCLEFFLNFFSYLVGEKILNSMSNPYKITEILAPAIRSQCHEILVDFNDLSRKCKLDIRSEQRGKQVQTIEVLKSHMNTDQKRVNEIAQESGSSNWLIVLPYEDSGYVWTKQEFWGASNLQFNWSLSRLPSKCACSGSFDLSHAFACKKEGLFPAATTYYEIWLRVYWSIVCSPLSIKPNKELTLSFLSCLA